MKKQKLMSLFLTGVMAVSLVACGGSSIWFIRFIREPEGGRREPVCRYHQGEDPDLGGSGTAQRRGQ